MKKLGKQAGEVPNQNLLTWFGYEEAVFEIAQVLDI